jgi:hypothetical protein
MKFVITRRAFSPTRDLFFYAGEIRFVMIRPDFTNDHIIALGSGKTDALAMSAMQS